MQTNTLPPILVTTKDESFVVMPPSDDCVNFFDFPAETQVFQIVGVHLPVCIDYNHISAAEENEISVQLFENSVEVVEAL